MRFISASPFCIISSSIFASQGVSFAKPGGSFYPTSVRAASFQVELNVEPGAKTHLRSDLRGIVTPKGRDISRPYNERYRGAGFIPEKFSDFCKWLNW
jgi:hypothetical protein